ncbi:Lytic transglycosylase, catalytic [Labilithrix luteola]|uniref:Lytic transglycosylase, catalytic n=1 Tax=Labilithrix luteola TaxID=1391654 RepID=A0A0K1PSL2_9BACT|nr:transglycosylase SLT domain-containing protein [Labilithrix luteola]AKU96114.1 Lytic transglycosylase, catalytic [Labilithrix luteola]
MKRRLGATLALLVATLPLLASSQAAADIYQWTDAEGVVHFTNRPSTSPGAKLYIKSSNPSGNTPRAGVTPFAPQDRDLGRYTRYDEHIRQAAALYQIPEQLVRAVIKVESDYDARAVSYAGARGLMQLMPETAERMQVKDINDPRENIFGGVRYLRVLANMFNGDLDLTVAAYNAGEGAVMTHGGIPPFAQTRDYVVKVTKFYRRYRTIADVVDASVGQPEPVYAPASVPVAAPAVP